MPFEYRKKTTKENNDKRKRARKRFIAENPICKECGSKENLTIDHILPKSFIKSKHNQKNWQVLCSDCNNRKQNHIKWNSEIKRLEKLILEDKKINILNHATQRD